MSLSRFSGVRPWQTHLRSPVAFREPCWVEGGTDLQSRYFLQSKSSNSQDSSASATLCEQSPQKACSGKSLMSPTFPLEVYKAAKMSVATSHENASMLHLNAWRSSLILNSSFSTLRPKACYYDKSSCQVLLLSPLLRGLCVPCASRLRTLLRLVALILWIWGCICQVIEQNLQKGQSCIKEQSQQQISVNCGRRISNGRSEYGFFLLECKRNRVKSSVSSMRKKNRGCNCDSMWTSLILHSVAITAAHGAEFSFTPDFNPAKSICSSASAAASSIEDGSLLPSKSHSSSANAGAAVLQTASASIDDTDAGRTSPTVQNKALVVGVILPSKYEDMHLIKPSARKTTSIALRPQSTGAEPVDTAAPFAKNIKTSPKRYVSPTAHSTSPPFASRTAAGQTGFSPLNSRGFSVKRLGMLEDSEGYDENLSEESTDGADDAPDDGGTLAASAATHPSNSKSQETQGLHVVASTVVQVVLEPRRKSETTRPARAKTASIPVAVRPSRDRDKRAGTVQNVGDVGLKHDDHEQVMQPARTVHGDSSTAACTCSERRSKKKRSLEKIVEGWVGTSDNIVSARQGAFSIFSAYARKNIDSGHSQAKVLSNKESRAEGALNDANTVYIQQSRMQNYPKKESGARTVCQNSETKTVRACQNLRIVSHNKNTSQNTSQRSDAEFISRPERVGQNYPADMELIIADARRLSRATSEPVTVRMWPDHSEAKVYHSESESSAETSIVQSKAHAEQGTPRLLVLSNSVRCFSNINSTGHSPTLTFALPFARRRPSQTLLLSQDHKRHAPYTPAAVAALNTLSPVSDANVAVSAKISQAHKVRCGGVREQSPHVDESIGGAKIEEKESFPHLKRSKEAQALETVAQSLKRSNAKITTYTARQGRDLDSVLPDREKHIKQSSARKPSCLNRALVSGAQSARALAAIANKRGGKGKNPRKVSPKSLPNAVPLPNAVTVGGMGKKRRHSMGRIPSDHADSFATRPRKKDSTAVRVGRQLDESNGEKDTDMTSMSSTAASSSFADTTFKQPSDALKNLITRQDAREWQNEKEAFEKQYPFGRPLTVRSTTTGRLIELAFGNVLGAGGQGVVFSATLLAEGTSVALKIFRIRPDGRRDDGRDAVRLRRRVQSELNIWNFIPSGLGPREWSELAHLVIPFDVVEPVEHSRHTSRSETRYAMQWIVMELFAGDLARMPKIMNASASVKLEVTEQIFLSSLKMHDMGLVHSDIKLPNFFIDLNGRIFLGDHSMSTPVGQTVSCTAGTVRYLPPENMKCINDGRRMIMTTERKDVWALGIVLYKLWCGTQYPYELGDLWSRDLFVRAARASVEELDFTGCDKMATIPILGLLRIMLDPQVSRRPTLREIYKFHPLFASQKNALLRSRTLHSLIREIQANGGGEDSSEEYYGGSRHEYSI